MKPNIMKETTLVAHVQAHTLLVLTYHRLLEMITSVIQHPMVLFRLCSMQMILSGMAMTVAEEAHAVHSTNLHGS